jgi:FKBP-type peptidyl-prolyl cis-trans isomerase
MVMIFFLPVFMISLSCVADEKETPKPKLETSSEKFSYIMGMNVIDALKKLDTEIDLNAFIHGVQDSYDGKASLLSPDEIAKVKKEVSKNEKQKQQEKIKAIAKKNLEEGKLFLSENKKKEGVISTESGLQYKIIKEGSGPFPKPEDIVSVHYRGTLINGKEFDNSYKRGEPTKVRVREVLPGWAEALQKVKVGSKFEICLPPHLGYGSRYAGAGKIVGPQSTLIFEVELLGIENPKG